MVNNSTQVNMAGNDEIVANERSRATLFPVTLTGAASLGTAYITNTQGINWVAGFGPPRTGTGAGTTLTVLAADLLTGIITWKNTNTSTITFTLDSAANFQTALNLISSGAQAGDIISCLIINSTGSGAGGTITIAAGANGSFDANQTSPVIAVGTSRVIYIQMTTVGSSPTYTIYC